VLATAKAQRWDPAEVLKALFAEEVSGRDRSALATRRAAAGFPTGKTFEAWQPEASSIPTPTQQARASRRAREDGVRRAAAGSNGSSGEVDRADPTGP
jgi:DNA replication protein DnaC